MDIAVKFININKEDVIATSCAMADLPVVQFEVSASSMWYLRYANGVTIGDCYYYLHGSDDSKTYYDFFYMFGVSGQKYHVKYDNENYVWDVYPCDSDCALSQTNPFSE